MRRPRRRAAGVLGAFLLLFLLLPALGAPALADDAPASEGPMTPEAMERWLSEKPAALTVLVVLRYGTIAIGVLLLILLYRRSDRVRAGLLPPTPRVEPTLAFPPGQALLVLFAFFLGGQLVGLALERTLPVERRGTLAVLGVDGERVRVRVETGTLVRGATLRQEREGAEVWEGQALGLWSPASDRPDATGQEVPSVGQGAEALVVVDGGEALGPGDALGVLVRARPPLLLQLGVNAAIFLPLAGLVLLRRRRLVKGPRPAPLAAFGKGAWTFCVANAVSVPALLLSLVLLQALGRPPTIYGPVQEVIRAEHALTPWLLGLYAVVVAPLGEESVFRGMLHPAVRELAGGGRRGAWVAAITVSLLFALIHFHALSFLPLMALALVLAWVFEKTDSLAAVIWAHALFNGASMLPLLLRTVL